MRLLVIGQQSDPHVESVRRRLKNEFDVRSDLLDFSASKGAGFSISNSSEFELSMLDGDAGKYFAIWRRYKRRVPIAGMGDEFRTEYVSAAQQLAFEEAVGELLDLRVINRPKLHRISKLRELKVARDVGLNVPSTIIPTKKEQIVDILNQQQSLICKSLGNPNTPKGDGSGYSNAIKTARVTLSDIAEIDEKTLTVCPHLFQYEIPKALELRVIATKHRCFAFSIDSQADELTSVDWRYGNTFLEFRNFDLDDSIVSRLRDYLRIVGLLYGTFDLILDPQGEFWFLECNIEGQWYWLEKGSGDMISYAIAEAIYGLFPKN